ncbi:MAG: TIGR03545 family protein, partial [Gammaproteobacteria bacterium]|nr:TIGR03545 family protein [Gammaproteobacteria bacterium]
MKNWIRWKGFIPFTLIIVAFALLFIVFIDSLARSLLESQGSKLVGAKVESRDLRINFFPFRVNIDDLQVTNPDAPMTNATEIGSIRFGMQLDQLLFGKVIIDEMQLDGVQLNTPRS